MGECGFSIDCFNFTTGVQKFCYNSAAFSELTNFCDCQLDIGWVGEKCDEPSPLLKFRRVTHIVALVLSFVLVILTTRSLFFSFMILKDFQGIKELSFVTGFLNCFSAVLYFINITVRLPGYFDPRYIDVYNFKAVILPEREEVFLKNHETLYNLSISYTALVYVTTLLIMQMFNKLLETLSRFNGDKAGVRRWGIMIKALVIIWFSLALGCIVAGFQVDGIVLAAIGGVFYGLFFPIYFLRLIRSLQHFAVTDVASIRRLVLLVKKVGVFLSVTNFLTATLLIVYMVTLANYNEEAILGQLDFVAMIPDIWRLIGLLSIGIIGWYLNSTSEGTILSEEYPRLSLLCYWWDRENTRILPDEPVAIFSDNELRQAML